MQSIDAGYERFDKLIQTISMLGSSMLGMGAMLAVTTNWTAVPGPVRIAVVAFITVATYAAGWRLSASNAHRRFGEALTFLGTIMYGVGIWLVAQICNYDLHFHQGLLMWAIGIAPVAFIARSGIIAVLCCSVLNAWLLLEPFNYGNLCFWAALAFALAYVIRSPWALSKALIGSAAWLVDLGKFGATELALFGIALCAGFCIHSTNKRLEAMSRPFLYIGTIITLAATLLLTEGHVERWSREPDQCSFWFILAVLVISIATGFFSSGKFRPELAGCVALAASIIGVSFIPDEQAGAALSHATTLAAIVGFLSAGIFRMRNQVVMILTMAAFSCEVAIAYFDTSFRLAERSCFFTLAGVALFALATTAQLKLVQSPVKQSTAVPHR